MFNDAEERCVSVGLRSRWYASCLGTIAKAAAFITRSLSVAVLIWMASLVHAQAPVTIAVTAPISGSGSMTLWVDSYSKTVRYGIYSSAASIASGFGGTISLDVNAPVWAKGFADGTLKMRLRQSGSVSNIHIDIAPDAGSAAPPITISTNVGGVQSQNPASGTAVYSYSVTTASGASGYDSSGNIRAFSDSVNAQWTAGYDSVNRLVSAFQSSTSRQFETAWGNAMQQYLCWQYDSFGNRMQQVSSSSAFANGTTCVGASGAATAGSTLSVTPDNRVSALLYAYDQAGNLASDGNYTYQYDGAGRMCAVRKHVTGAITAYLYDAEGHRVAKGDVSPTAAKWCDFGTNGFVMTSRYVMGPGGTTLTELNVSAGTSRSDIPLAGGVAATITSNASSAEQMHFQFTDMVGTRRVQTDALGVSEEACQGGLFGDFLRCTGMESTPNHFTGKERDAESGLDYFGARYYGSSMGRFMSPDPSGLALADMNNPQSFNLYSYVLNNPLNYIDPDGLECVWDDGSFDSADDKQTGSHAGCSKAGGTYVDPKAFGSLNAGDWSNKANQTIADVATALSSSSTTVNVRADGSGSLAQDGFNYSSSFGLMLTQFPLQSWSGDRSLALATGVMSTGIPKLCGVGFSGNVGKYKVGVSMSGNGVGGNVNGHSVGTETPQSPGVDMRSASPLFKTVPVGVYLSPSDPRGNTVSSVSGNVGGSGTLGRVKLSVKGAVYANLGTYTPNLSDPQNCAE